jgi:hypothetical protein
MSSTELIRKGQEMLLEESVAPFELSSDGDMLEEIARDLISQRQQTDAQLSFALHGLCDTARHVEKAHATFNDYVEAELGFSGQKARSLIQGWLDFQALGLNPAILSQISWSKFRELGPGISRGLITKDNVAEWLPRVANSGEFTLRVADVKAQVRLLTADNTANVAMPGEFSALPAFKVPSSQMNDVQRNLEVVKEAFSKPTGGEGTVMSRMLEYVAATVVDGSIDANKVNGVLNLKRNIERITPGFTVVLIQTEAGSKLPADAQVVPATKIYQYGDDFVIATDINDASRMFDGVDNAEIQEHSLMVSDAFHSSPIADIDIDAGLPDPDSIPVKERNAVLKSMAKQLKDQDETVQAEFADFRKTIEELPPEEAFTATFIWFREWADNKNLVILL